MQQSLQLYSRLLRAALDRSAHICNARLGRSVCGVQRERPGSGFVAVSPNLKFSVLLDRIVVE